MAVNSAANLFIADIGNYRVRRVDAVTRFITTVAGDGSAGFGGDGLPATSAQLRSPQGLAIDGAGNLFIADSENQRVRRVDAGNGLITTVADSGLPPVLGPPPDAAPALSVYLGLPFALAAQPSSANLFITDQDQDLVYRLDTSTGVLTRVAGGGSTEGTVDGVAATEAQLSRPKGLSVDASGNLFIAEAGGHRVRRVDAATGTIATVAGTGMAGFNADAVAATTAQLNQPQGLALDVSGNLLIADTYNQRVRRVEAATGLITTVVGTGTAGLSGDGGPATSARISYPGGLALRPGGPTAPKGTLFISDVGNNRVRRVTAPPAVAAVADFDGDGHSDISVFRPSTGTWYARNQAPVVFGTQPGDVPVPGDYDGDDDVAVFRSGTWHVRNQARVVLGTVAGDVPVRATTTATTTTTWRSSGPRAASGTCGARPRWSSAPSRATWPCSCPTPSAGCTSPLHERCEPP